MPNTFLAQSLAQQALSRLQVRWVQRGLLDRRLARKEGQGPGTSYIVGMDRESSSATDADVMYSAC